MNQGQLQVTLTDAGDPNANSPLADGDDYTDPDTGESHGLWGYSAILEAEETGLSSLDIFVWDGCALGNGTHPVSGDPMPYKVQIQNGTLDDDTESEVDLLCVDCEDAAVEVELIQRVRHEFELNYHLEDGSEGKVPEWWMQIRSTMISGRNVETTFEGAYNPDSFQVDMGASSIYAPGEDDEEPEVLQVDDDAYPPAGWEDYPGGWNNEIEVDQARQIFLRAYYTDFKAVDLACNLPALAYITNDAEFEWEMSMVDYSGVDFDADRYGSLHVEEWYASALLIWKITVTKNWFLAGFYGIRHLDGSMRA